MKGGNNTICHKHGEKNKCRELNPPAPRSPRTTQGEGTLGTPQEQGRGEPRGGIAETAELTVSQSRASTESGNLSKPPGPPSSKSKLVLDGGSTVHFGTVDVAVIDKRPTTDPIKVTFPNGSIMESTHEAEIDAPALPLAACKIHILPELSAGFLLSIGQFCDSSCSAHFCHDRVDIVHNKVIILQGTRKGPHSLWHLLLSNSLDAPPSSSESDQQIFGNFDFNRTPLGPAGSHVLVWEAPAAPTTCSPHAQDGWCIGPAMESCRCFRTWMIDTRKECTSDTVVWHPAHVHPLIPTPSRHHPRGCARPEHSP